jgi:iron complex transport system permease protein
MNIKKHVLFLSIWISILWAWNLSDYSQTGTWIMQEFRLPRLWGGFFSGMGLALSGLMMQTLFRNPLAGPFLLGVTPGASLGMALFLLGGNTIGFAISQWGSAAASLVGALGALLLQLILNNGFKSPLKMLLIGMVMSFVFSAGVQLLMQFSKAQDLQRYALWGMGSFDSFKRNEPVLILIPVLVIGVLVWVFRKGLDTYLLGDEYAISSNYNLFQIRLLLIVGGAILAGWITAFAGPIGFVGLVAPHISKRILKSESHAKILWVSLLWGGALCMSADTLAHHLIPHAVLPVNPICALIGAPVLIYSLIKGAKYTHHT